MSEDFATPPLLSLIKENNLIDDLQYEEVLGEFKRTGKPIIQILQDFSIMDLDNVLHVMADHLGTRVVSLRDSDLPPQVIQSVPAKAARMYQCLPVFLQDGTLQVALVDPLNPQHLDQLGFVAIICFVVVQNDRRLRLLVYLFYEVFHAHVLQSRVQDNRIDALFFEKG